MACGAACTSRWVLHQVGSAWSARPPYLRIRSLDLGADPFNLHTVEVIVDLCLVPMGVGVSVSSYVAECQRVLSARGLKFELHAYGTNIEGEWDDVMSAIKACHEAVHQMGAPRITSTIKLGTRTDRKQTMADKVSSVRDKLR